MVNPKSLANLKQNQYRGGKQPGAVSLNAALKKYCSEHPEKVKTMVESWIEQAHTSPAFAQIVADRIDGKLPQPVSGDIKLTHSIAFEVGKGYKE